MLNFLIFPRTPQSCSMVFGGIVQQSWVFVGSDSGSEHLSITVRPTVHLHWDSLSGVSPLTELHCHGGTKGRGTTRAPQSGAGDEELTRWPLEVYEALGPPCVSSVGLPVATRVLGAFGRTKCGIPDSELGWALPVPSLSWPHKQETGPKLWHQLGWGFPPPESRSSTYGSSLSL